MNWSDSFRNHYPHLVRRLRFLIFIQIFLGILFLIISPVHAAADTNSVTDPHSVWVKSFEQTGNAGSYTVIATSDGGSVTSGSYISSPGLSDIYLSLIHISEPTRRTPISYAVFCLKKKKTKK